MAYVQFALTYDFAAPPPVVWNELIDWKGHERWVPATKVVLHGPGGPTDVGAEFTAWTGIGRTLALQDRMRVESLSFDAATGKGACTVAKVGPFLSGEAAFTVEPASAGTRMVWTEAVTVPYAPQMSAGLLARIGLSGFTFVMGRLAALMRASPSGAVSRTTFR